MLLRSAVAYMVLVIGPAASSFAREQANIIVDGFSNASLTQAQNATVAGQVLNRDGTPAARMPIRIERETNQPTQIIVGLGSMGRTDGEGRFRLTELPAGRYRLVAGSPEFDPTYYPGTLIPSEAEVLNVNSNTVLENLSFRIV